MNQIKIGRFIAECRKNNNLTQMQLAEKLNITDRAVSKWGTGKSMPDSTIMLDLCRELKISVNDLLNGEIIVMENYKEKTEQLLLEMAKQKEKSDKKGINQEVR
ncbi:MAG: helix-turn-helix transcriptional regulator [Ruminococcaceae bacterium]|nr:helix-turn-helix transcriptional regulator [Oscillospiraceae bacterium]